MRPDTPIVIVGGGPVGLACALALSRRDLPVLVLETDPGFCEGSRAICISRRSLQILDRLGVGDAFVEKGLHWTEGHSFLGAREVFHLVMPMSGDDRFPPFINLQQYYAEQFLYEEVVARPNTEVRWQATVTGLEQNDAAVRVTWEEGGETRSVETPWLIACDGARSTVRRLTGRHMQGEAYEGRYLIADIEIALDWPTERRVWFDPPSNPGSTVIMHRQPDNVWRLDYQLRAEEDPEEALQEANVRPRIQRHLEMVGKGDLDWTLLWSSLYRAHCLSLPSYRSGRVLFAGDAAHLVPIFGVRGMNSGIDDAYNLAWKLAAVQTGEAPVGLLDSYSVERHGAYEDNIAAAKKSTWFMSPPSTGFQMARDAVLELAVDEPGLRCLVNPRQSSAHRYVSPAIVDPPTEGVATPGWPLADIRLSNGRDVYALLGPDYTALLIGEDTDTEISEGAALDGLSLRIITIPATDHAAQALEAQSGDLLLLRPDQHIALRRSGVTMQTAELLCRDAHETIMRATAAHQEGVHV